MVVISILLYVSGPVWGHVNNGNAHINIVTPGQHVRNGTLAAIVEEIVYDSVV